MKINEILNEAGEPENPSRRGFLKALGAAGVAAAMPGTAVKALSTPAAAAAEVPAAAAAASSTIMADLFQAAVMHGADSDWKDQENDWDDDAPDGSWNEEFDDFQGKEGTTPWGEMYEVQTSPGGNLFLYTGSPYGESGVLTYKKNGETHTLELDWDTTIGGLDSVLYASDDADEEIYNNYLEKHGRIDEADLGKLIDAIIAGPSAGNAPGKSRKEREEEEQERWWEEYNRTHKPYRVYNKHTGEIEKVINATDDQDAIEKLVNYKGQYWQYDPAKHEMFSADEHLHGPRVGGERPPERKINIPGAGTTAADLARLAGIAKRGYDAAMSAGEPAEPKAAEPQKPQALPKPTDPDIDLTPNLKQKQAEPAKKRDNK